LSEQENETENSCPETDPRGNPELPRLNRVNMPVLNPADWLAGQTRWVPVTDVRIPRSNSRSSTFRNESGNRTYIITTRRITSGEELK
jgi:hypothetical protein